MFTFEGAKIDAAFASLMFAMAGNALLRMAQRSRANRVAQRRYTMAHEGERKGLELAPERFLAPAQRTNWKCHSSRAAVMQSGIILNCSFQPGTGTRSRNTSSHRAEITRRAGVPIAWATRTIGSSRSMNIARLRKSARNSEPAAAAI